ncbi:hypothetical protein COOONC_12816 [Cooperia oncophora]
MVVVVLFCLVSKVSDSIQICSYGNDLVVVMGMPLWFNSSEKSELDRIHKWIVNCRAPRWKTAVVLADVRQKIKNPGIMKSSPAAFISSIALLTIVLLAAVW